MATVRVALPPPLAGASDAPESIEERLEQFRRHSDRVHDEILPRLRQLPGVVTAAATTRLPFPGELNGTSVRIVGREGPAGLFNVRTEDVTPGYHETLRIPIREGRTFTAADISSPAPVVVMSENLARRYWPHASPIGARLRGLFRPGVEAATIIGVAGDVKRNKLGAEHDAVVWRPFAHSSSSDVRLVVRTAGDPASILPAMRRSIRSMDPRMAVSEATAMSAPIGESAKEERFRTLLMVVFGALGSILAAVGVFGVAARSVAQRTREFGIRLALGAEHRRLVRGALGESVRIALFGLAAGLATALALTQVLSGILFGVTAWDPLTYAVVVALVIGVVAGASLVPVCRITRVAPAEVLRCE